MKHSFLLLMIFCLLTGAAMAQKKPKKKKKLKQFELKIHTLSKGKYDETFHEDTLMPVGLGIINTQTWELATVLPEDTVFKGMIYHHGVEIRWLSMDPLADEMSSWSPYSFSFNSPLRFVDPDGRMPFDVFGDFFDKKGNYLGTDGIDDGRRYVVKNKSEVQAIKKANKRGETTDAADVNSSILLTSDVSLQTSLEVLRRTEAPTADDPDGGLHGESALVFNDGTVVFGQPGARGVITPDNDFHTREDLPNLPAGMTADDIEVNIHSHSTGTIIQNNQVFGGNARIPSNTDLQNPTFMSTESIIVGRFGNPQAEEYLNTTTNQMQIRVKNRDKGL
ncbi:MAG: hypothetical protein AAF734_11775, partial [Bacteroidota bacterium]